VRRLRRAFGPLPTGMLVLSSGTSSECLDILDAAAKAVR
jgi:hypothetical protein